jgi:glutamine synthetase
LLDTYFALKTEELTLTEQLSPAELCEHYARLY